MAEQLTIQITARDGASQTFRAVGSSAQQMGQQIDKAATSGDGFASLTDRIGGLESEITTVGTAFTAFGVVTTGAFALAARESIQLETAMANVASIAGESETVINDLTDQVRDLAVELGREPTELADGLYEIVSSGFEATDAMQILEQTTVAAVSGMTDAETATRAVVAVLNAYGLSAEDAGDVSDIFFQTVESGTASFEALANNLSQVLPIAASLGIEFEEVAAAMAELSLQGFSAAAAETGIAAVMRAALRPTQELTAAVQELGFASVEALIEAEGMVGLLRVLEAESGGTAEGMSLLISDIQGVNAALALTSGGVDGYAQSVQEMSAAARDGATTQEAFAIQTDTTAFALQQAQAAVRDVAITFGDALAPAIREGAELASTAAQAFRELPEPVQEWTAVLGAGTGAMALFTGGLVLAIPKVVEFTAAMRTLTAAGGVASLGTALAAAGAPLLTFGAVVGGLAPVFIGTSRVAADFVNTIQEGGTPLEGAVAGLERLQSAGERLSSGDLVGFFRELVFGIDEAETSIAAFNTTVTTLLDEAARQQVLGNTEVAESLEFLAGRTNAALIEAENYIGSAEFLAQANAVAAQTTGNVDRATEQLTEEFTQSEAEARVYTEAVNALGLAMLDPANNAAEIDAAVQELTSQFYAGEITLDQYREGLVDLAREYGTMPGEVSAATTAVASFTDGADAAITATLGHVEALRQYNATMAETERNTRTLNQLGVEGPAAPELDFEAPVFGPTAEEAEQVQAAIDEARVSADQYADSIVSAHERILGPVREATDATHALAVEGYAELGASAQAAVDDVLALRDALFELGTAGAAGGLAGVDALNQGIQAFIASGRELAGLDDALSTFNLTSLATETTRLAEATLTAGSALESTFRIIVGGTNAIGQSTQAVEDWIASLATAEDGWTTLDQLVEDNRISTTEAAAAYQAYDDIVAANTETQQTLLAIQAQQAPLLAELTTQQAAYVASLGELPAQQQLITLGWMDAATAAQAMEAQTLAAAAASGELGESGYAATQQFIEGAVAANPVLEQLLTDIGLVARDHEGNLVINFAGAEGAESEIERLTRSIDALIVTLGGVPPIDIEADTAQAQEAVGDVIRELEWLEATGQVTTTVTTDTNAALTAMAGASAQLDAMDGDTSTVYVAGDIGAAASAMSAASAQLSGLNGDSATVYVNAVNNAGGVIGSVANQLAGLNGRTATTYIDTVYRSFGSAAGAAFGSMHGGIPELQHGGVVFRAGEAGPEVAHFANGGTALLPYEGMYVAPPMTYISPANASQGQIGGDINITINHQGGSVEDFDDMVVNRFMPALVAAIDQQRRAYGMKW